MAHTDTLLFISLHSVTDTDELGVSYKATGTAIRVSGNLIQAVYEILSRGPARKRNRGRFQACCFKKEGSCQERGASLTMGGKEPFLELQGV